MTQTPGTPTSNAPAPSLGPARYQQIDQGQLDAWRRKGARNIGFGILWLVAGLLITLITMSSSSAHGGFYIIAFGPIIGGAIQIISGYRTHQRGTNTPPSPAADPVSTASSTAPNSPPTTPGMSGGAARSAQGTATSQAGTGASAWHPIRSITRGMKRDEVRRRLGEPTTHTASPTTSTSAADVIWVYQDTPPGQHTEITLTPDGDVDDVTTHPGNAPAHERPPGRTHESPNDAQPENQASAGTATPRLLRRSAVRAHAQGELTDAKALHRQVIDTRHPLAAPASMIDLAELLEAEGDTAGAVELLEQAAVVGDSEQAEAARGHVERLAVAMALTPAGVATTGGSAAEVLSASVAAASAGPAPQPSRTSTASPAVAGRTLTYLLQSHISGQGWVTGQKSTGQLSAFGTVVATDDELPEFAKSVIRRFDNGTRTMRIVFFRGHVPFDELSIEKAYGDVTPKESGGFCPWLVAG